MRVVLVVALVACDQGRSPPRPTPDKVGSSAPAVRLEDAAAAAPAMRIEDVRALSGSAYEHAERDCRLSTVVRRRFAGAKVRACGTFDLVTDADWEQARDRAATSRKLRPAVDCVSAAVKEQRPFIVEQRVPGTDSGVDRGLVGVLEQGKLAVYQLDFDSNPCGGGCPERGHTAVKRCDGFSGTPVDTDCADLLDCFHCDTTPVEDCVFGDKQPK